MERICAARLSSGVQVTRPAGTSTSASSTMTSAGTTSTGRAPSLRRSIGSPKATTPPISPGAASHSDRSSFSARPQITAASSSISA